jgi:hypothetical protein
MNKKMAVTLMASVFMLVAMSQQVVLAADSLSECFGLLGVEVGLDGTFVLQTTPKTDITKTRKTPVSGLFDLNISKEFENNGEIALHFKDGEGECLETGTDLSTYANVNASADFTKSIELFYKHSWFDNKLTANFGKFDLWRFFAGNKLADDASSQFVTAAFGTDKLIDSGSCGPSLRLGLALCKEIDIDYAYFTPSFRHIDKNAKKGINIIQANFKPFENGNYRLYAWQDNADHYTFAGNKASKSYGAGISADQAVSEDLGLFARFGYKYHSVGTYTSEKEKQFSMPLSAMWNFGMQIKGSKWSRENDTIGIALGQIFGSSKAKGHMPQCPNYKDSPETHMELYYRFVPFDHFAFTPAVQYIINPAGGNISSKNPLVFGIRATFHF